MRLAWRRSNRRSTCGRCQPRRLWERVGGYPEWLYTAEDTLFALAAGRLAEYKVVYAPASVLYWRPRPTLRKMARMFYLYGRGNGRIQNAATSRDACTGCATTRPWLLGRPTDAGRRGQTGTGRPLVDRSDARRQGSQRRQPWPRGCAMRNLGPACMTGKNQKSGVRS